jgi:aryl-alcohol dehydrogenase-like predicted oxidoreductase
MKYRRLGSSGLKVSTIGLGTASVTFVGRTDDATSDRIIRHALDLGITYYDTGETYAEGRAETALGRALGDRREDVVIATKFGKDRSVTESEQRGSRRRIMKAVEGSLRRLRTDYIDLYILHEPDPDTPIEETLECLDDLRRSGKIRYAGCSDLEVWQLVEAIWTSRVKNLISFVSAGTEYNLLNRVAEESLIPRCQAYGVGIVPTFPLASGFLTGKYRPGEPLPAGSRFASVAGFAAPVHQNLSKHAGRLSEENFAKLKALVAFAQERGHTTSELAIAWLLAQPAVGGVPIGVTTMEQMTENIRAVDWELTSDDLRVLDELSAHAGGGTTAG